MPTRILSIVLVLASLLIGLAACGGGQQPIETATSVALVSPSPSDAPTAPPPTDTPPPMPPTKTATSPLPSDTPTSTPSATAPPTLTATDTPTPVPPTNTPTPSPPTATPTVAATQPRDPSTIRVELQLVVGGLEAPTGLAHAGDGTGRLFVLDKAGRIHIVRDGSLLPTPFLDISDRVGSSGSEQGLLGLAFHPNYANNGAFFVNYTDRQGDTVVARYAVSDEPDRADPASEAVLLSLAQPARNHNGGHLAFGPDGYLYVGTGDGGGAGDQYGNGQNGATLLGAMLCLDVDGGQPYAVPPNNPFVGDPNVRDEIWAIGLRNPWRYTFDRQTGDLYIADVGQNAYEEINVQPAGSSGGQNYGWPIMEGRHCFPADRPCDRAGLTLPVREYDHGQGCSVTGGYVYRGVEYPLLNGVYLFGDYCSGRIWGLTQAADGDWQMAQLARPNVRLSSFGEDETGELYVVDLSGGGLYQVTASSR